MTLDITIKKKLKSYDLDIEFKSDFQKIGLFGPSGAGKTQLLKSIAGITELKSGCIKLDGEVLYNSDKNINVRPQDREVGYLFQSYALFPHMTVRKQIELTSKVENLEELYKKFRIEHLLDSKPNNISGGEAQRVAMVRMLASKPKIILLDEPFSAIDMNLKVKLRSELKEMLKEFYGTVVIVSHDIDDITELCEEIIFIEKGRVIADERVESFGNYLNKDMARLIGYESIKIKGRDIYYNPKKFKTEYSDGDTKFKGKVVSIVNSLNYNILNLKVEGQILRAEFLRDLYTFEVDSDLELYQTTVN
ncbi:ATP-binding cassette domain-containing protein [Peptoniphilus indolicus]|uniref:Sulfate/thiosulfate import ATP-binding protein CysA n=2 Tax=Peptoniphilus indolicus TaxID=33030 RepID=A0A379DCK3_9FIRM|nr:ATP-binding cassette domain-containing protein [Peptoniphilus indolicus]SUB75674.1 Sulfate/thiosulfate import ATP-binding protein CysA [Peptoniphilus indolicus]